MGSFHLSRVKSAFFALLPLTLVTSAAFAGSVTILSPHPSATVTGAVSISAKAEESTAFHLEIWDNGHKVGNYHATSVNITPVMALGRHIMIVQAVAPSGKVLDKQSVVYTAIAAKPPVSTPPATTTPTSGALTITSPAPGATSISAVTIDTAMDSSTPVHLEIKDNGLTLGIVQKNSVRGVYVLPSGSHVLTVEAIDDKGSLVSSSSVNYTVAEACSNSRYAQCNIEQMPIDHTQDNCSPKPELMWIANGCGGGVQGVNPTNPLSTSMEPINEGGALPNQNNLSLNGQSMHFSEMQGTSHPSNVLFRGQSPSTVPTGAIDSHWTLEEYVHLPDPTAHQAFEMDAQYTAGGIWTKFYTECAFNHYKGTGIWGVFDTETGGWIFLDGQIHNGQQTPLVPCTRSQFEQPWAGSSNPGFTGWHHIKWSFLRNSDGTVTFQKLVFDGTTTDVNFTPVSQTGGSVKDNGNFSALVQLDGVVNTDGAHNLVDAYVSEINLMHTP